VFSQIHKRGGGYEPGTRERLLVSKASYGVKDLVLSSELVHYLTCPRFPCPGEVRCVETAAQDQHGRARADLAQPRDKVRSDTVGEVHVKDRHVATHRRGVATGFLQRTCLDDHLEVWLPVHLGGHKVSEVGLVIHQHYSDHRRFSSGARFFTAFSARF
jgi:hypothetical protein